MTVHTNNFSEGTQVYTDTYLLLKSILTVTCIFNICMFTIFVPEMVSLKNLLHISSPKCFKVCAAKLLNQSSF